jgi:subtilisin family serine protease
VVVVSSDMAQARALAARLQGTGIRVLRRRILHQLGFVLSTLAFPKGTGAPAVLAQLRALAPKAWIDLNSRYRLLGSTAHRYARKLIGWRRRAGCGARVRIGLVDTGADAHHPALAHAHLDQREFLTDGYRAAPREHGTAEAAILLGNDADDLRGLLPRAHLFLAAVFRKRAHDTADATAEQVALALNWLVGRGVSVIVLPLGGPRNLLIEAAVRRTLQRSIAVTAAAGNGGPDAAPVYPAAQAGVIAVTAVDADGRIYTHANHGAYIDFAAPGVDLWVARPGGGAHYVSGTSYATPFVGAALAIARERAPRGAWAALVRNLAAHARDLGAHGRDPVYGWGLLHTRGCARARRGRSPPAKR